MRVSIIIFSLFLIKAGFAQDTTYFNEYQLASQEYNNLSQKLGNKKVLLDRAVMLDIDKILTLKNSLSPLIVANDWLYLYHAKNLCEKNQDLSNKVTELTTYLFSYTEQQSGISAKFTLPLGVLDFKGYNVKSNRYTDGTLTFSNGWRYSNQNPNFIFDENRYSLTSILSDAVFTEPELRLECNSDFFFVENKKVKKIHITYAGQKYTIEDGEAIDLTLNENDSVIYFKTEFKNNEVTFNSQKLKIKFNSFNQNKNVSYFPNEFVYNASDEPSISDLTLNYNILYGTCNTTLKIIKPIIMLHGYRPPIQNGLLSPSLEELYYSKFNFEGSEYGSDGFCELLAKNGYDVIICRIDPAHNSIIDGGKMIKSFLKNIVEVQKNETGSKYETIVLGFSMGGQFLRSALMQMESEHFFNNEDNHHVRMWIPIDSPNEGANIPLAHQYAAKSLHDNPAGASVFNMSYNGLLTQGSKEQLRYHFQGNPGNDGAFHAFHPARVNYLSILNNVFYLGESLTKYRGYPSATRNVAVSVGSNSDDDYQNLSTGGLTWSDNSHVYGAVSHKKWDVKLYSEKFVAGGGNPHLLFKRKITRKFYWSSSTNVLVNDLEMKFNLLEMDNCQGSYHNKIRETINDHLDWNSLLGFNDYDYEGNQVFMPMLSALAINPNQWPTNMRYNLKTNGLMFNSFDLDPQTGISNYFGYPHLGRPNDYQTLTPMDAIFCNDISHEHISLIPVGLFPDPNSSADNSELLGFLLNEIEPWYLDLQNQDLGKYARADYTYQAKYRARNWIRTGFNLSPKTPFGDYKVLPNADLDLEAGEVIEFKTGTHIQAGAKVHAYIGTGYCHLDGLIQNPSSQSKVSKNVFIDDKNIFLDSNYVNFIPLNNMIYPNPNEGAFFVQCEALGTAIGELFIYNSQGILLANLKVQNKEFVTLNSSLKNSLLIAKLFINGIPILESKISVL